MDYSSTPKYPVVFVHGMYGWGDNEGINKKAPYWGATTGSLTDRLREYGCECYCGSVGPMSPAWDQACELYAQLTGTRVDYGVAHSRKFGHERFGRTYEKPLFDGWSKNRKVHLIGHSFGGICIRMLSHLMVYGAPEEVEAAGDDVSPLFKGGQTGLIASITAICSPLSGTRAHVVVDKTGLINPTKFISLIYAGLMSRTSVGKKYTDFHMERLRLTNMTDKKDADPIVYVAHKYYTNTDSIDYDISVQGSKELNDRIEIVPDIYYFSYQYNMVQNNRPVSKIPILTLISGLMLKYAKTLPEDEAKFYIENDGLIDVESAKYPIDEPHKDYSAADELEPGIWHAMPTLSGDHGKPIGLFADRNKTLSLYLEMLNRLAQTEQRDVVPNAVC